MKAIQLNLVIGEKLLSPTLLLDSIPVCFPRSFPLSCFSLVFFSLSLSHSLFLILFFLFQSNLFQAVNMNCMSSAGGDFLYEVFNRLKELELEMQVLTNTILHEVIMRD